MTSPISQCRLLRILFAAALVAVAVGTTLAAQAEDAYYILEGQALDAKLGAFTASVPDVNGDGIDDLASGNHRIDGPAGTDAGRVVLFDGATGKQLWKVEGEQAGGLLGHDVWGIGDVDNDGRGDVLASAYRYSYPGHPGAGKVYLLSGKDGKEIWHYDGEETGEEIGYALCAVPDLDNDKIPDVLAGAWLRDQTGANAGRLYVLSGKDGKLIRTHDGVAAGDRLGCSAAGFPDLDGDGYGDYVIGALYAGPNKEGQIYRYSGKTGSVVSTLSGEASDDVFGWSVAAIDDLDGDKLHDLIVGAAQYDLNAGAVANAGRAYVFSLVKATTLKTFDGEKALDRFGRYCTAIPDQDGDGLSEVAIGAPNHTGGGNLASGAAYVFSGGKGIRLRKVWGEAAFNQFGFALAGLNDVNGDGRGDLVVGAYQYLPNATKTESYGRIYVYADGLSASVTTLSASLGGEVRLDLDGSFNSLNHSSLYMVVASVSGNHPGLEVSGLHVPINFDLFTLASWIYANSPVLVDSYGKTDSRGRATIYFRAPAGFLRGYAGLKLTFAAVMLDKFDMASNPVPITIVP